MKIDLSFPFVEVQGDPYERGVSYGRAADNRIARTIEIYRAAFRDAGVSFARALEIAEDFGRVIKEFSGEHHAELEGIACGAGIAFNEVLAINARTEILYWSKPATGPQPQKIADECSGVFVLPTRSESGQVIHAQNWDWVAECLECCIVLKADLGNVSILTFTEAGLLARSGLNSAGIALTANGLQTGCEYGRLGVPTPCIRRRILESQTLSAAVEAAVQSRRAFSSNLMLTHRDGSGIDLETTPDRVYWLFAEDGLLTHTNHFKCAVARVQHNDEIVNIGPDTILRDHRLESLLAAKPTISEHDVIAALSDNHDQPRSICRPRTERRRNYWSATVAMILLRPHSGEMLVRPMPALNDKFATYQLHQQG